MKIHLITNCTSRKLHKLTSKVHLKDISKDAISPSENWTKILSKQVDLLPALDAYAGDHWAKVKDIERLGASLWIVSAGYGLISADTKICSYNATFNSNDENSVSKFYSKENLKEKNRCWWKDIHKGRESSIEKIYFDHPGDIFFIALPPNYLKVIEPELDNLASCGVINLHNTYIFSSKQDLSLSLKECFYQAKEDFCEQLGGSRVSLIIRLARYIFKGLSLKEPTYPQVQKMYNALLLGSSPVKHINRRKMTDKNVIDFILTELNDSTLTKISTTKLLKKMRDQGMGCEHKRFSKIYSELLVEIKNTNFREVSKNGKS
ncbi:hypothetical protein LCGC14_1844270 [marine sediment metagenome]|uniref:Uncharacterized protein n=1 Tax=marine sediment metagenome TaxID=412755 RepID=A0A0F9H0J9_9ZZZZ